MSQPHWRSQTAEDARDTAVRLLSEWLRCDALGDSVSEQVYDDTVDFLGEDPAETRAEEVDPDVFDQQNPPAA